MTHKKALTSKVLSTQKKNHTPKVLLKPSKILKFLFLTPNNRQAQVYNINIRVHLKRVGRCADDGRL